MAIDAFTIALSKVTVAEWREADHALALYKGNTEAARMVDWIDMQGEEVKDYYHDLRRTYPIHKSAALTHARFNAPSSVSQ
jgi:hypothetical protein